MTHDILESLREATGVDMDPFSSSGGGSEGALGLESPRNAAALRKDTGPQGLTKVAELILASDARCFGENPEDDEESLKKGRARLAGHLGCRPEDLEEIVAGYGAVWAEWVLESRVQMGLDSIALRDATWDNLESAAMKKLLFLVNTNSVRQPMELLAIAKAANTANRGRRGQPSVRTPESLPTGGQSMNIGIGLGFLPGDPEKGVLPAGNLGTINLSLNPRIQRQLAKPVDEDKEMRVIDSVEMLDLKAIQKAGDDSQE